MLNYSVAELRFTMNLAHCQQMMEELMKTEYLKIIIGEEVVMAK